MTTICTDGKTMAGDSQVSCSFTINGDQKKIFRLKDGSLIGFAGSRMCIQPCIDWLNGGEKPTFKSAEFTALILKKNAEVIYLCEEFHPDIVSVPCAIGTGEKYAMALLIAGHSPREAVKIAIKLDPDSGGKIQEMRI